LQPLRHYEQSQINNTVKISYSFIIFILLAGLPAIKPDFMQGPASKAKKIKKQQQQQKEEAELSDFEALGNVDVTNSDSDEDWTPDMERRKRAKG